MSLAFSARRGQDDAPSHTNRGVAFMEQFQFEGALSEFQKALAFAPKSAAAHVNLALAYFNLRDFDRALESLKQAEALDSGSVWVHYNLGLVAKLQGRTEDAIASFQRVSASDPEDASTQYYLGTLYATLGRLEEAQKHLRAAIALDPGNASAHFSLGNALIRAGAVEEGKKELDVFRTIKETFPGDVSSAGLQYTELGKYAEAMEEPSARAQGPGAAPTGATSALRFVDVTDSWGVHEPALGALPPLPDSIPSSAWNRDFIETRLLPHLGSGLAFRDLDSDGDPDLLHVRGGALEIFRNDGGRFSPLPAFRPQGFVSLTVGDIDNDGDADVFLVGPRGNALLLNDGKAAFEDATEKAGALSPPAVGGGAPTTNSRDVRGGDVAVAAALADVDHDGDLDIYVSTYVDPDTGPSAPNSLRVPWDLPGAPNHLYRNNGNGTFTDIAKESRTDGGASRSLGAVFSDFDDDRDIDFIVLNDGQPAQIFSNDRVGTFTEKALAWGVEASGRLRSASTGDFDRDGRFDLLLTGVGSPLNALFRGPAPFSPDTLSPALLASGVPGARGSAQFLDADNDADLDALVVINEGPVLAALFENTPSGFVRGASLVAAESDTGAGRSLALADVDGDGDIDAAIGTDRGCVLLFKNEGGNAKRSLRLLTRGLRSNRDGIGAKVEVKVGDARLRREVQTASGFLSQNELPLHFGLGERTSADYVRFLWPGGVKQIEIDAQAGTTLTVEELNRKGTSCPILYAWDGKAMRFVTDFLGGSAVGYLLAPGTYNTPDTNEYVKLEEFPLEPRAGAYDIRWVNQLEEVLMYDRAALLAVDHPADVEVFPNERLMPGPPFPEAKLYAVSGVRPVARATDHQGRDVSEVLARRDRRYASDFALLPFKGYAEPHTLSLDLGRVSPGEHVVLLLYGWVDYADSSANLAAAQAGVKLLPPRLEVEGGQAGKTPGKTLPSMGFPAGLPKTMLVDLENLVGPEAHEVKIRTSMRIYWDEIRVATVRPDVNLVISEMVPDRAELRFQGFPRAVEGLGTPVYDYEHSQKEELWDHHRGAYTRYGDVKPLVSTVDDRYVVTRGGDELALGFDAKKLPALAPGRSRTFILLADGFGKDMDLNSAHADTVEPLPFHGMTSYPYPKTEHYPDGPAYRQYREAYNTRTAR